MSPNSRLASPRATIQTLQEYGLHTRKSLGQHFLVDDNIVGRILALADISADEPVLEIGPGIGTLTVALCAEAGHVLAIERDPRLLPVLENLVAECRTLTIIHGDALKIGADDLVTPLGPPVALVANLPYSIAATLVLSLFQSAPSLASATVMVQSEVADRMSAEPSSKDYGAFTVKLGLLARTTGRFRVARSCFLPPPRVDSSVIRLDRITSMASAAEIAAAGSAAGAAFAYRRKTLRNSLCAALGADIRTVDLALEQAGIDGLTRAENLDIQQFVQMGIALRGNGLLP